jgi:hypothetical protein
MLDFALEYQKAIKLMVADPDHGLSQFAMLMQEWKILTQLRDVLKVSHNCDICGLPSGCHHESCVQDAEM